MKIIGMRIKGLRFEQRMTQKNLADRLGLTPKMVSFYELGQRTPPMDMLLKLTDIFNVSSDYLLGKVDEKNSSIAIVAQKLKKLCADFKDTPAGVAEYLNISLAEYEMLESGKKQADIETLALLERGCELPGVYCAEARQEDSDSLELNIQRLIQELSEKEKTQVIRYMQLVKNQRKMRD